MAKETKTKVKNDAKQVKYSVGTRGRTFEGYVIKKFPGRVVIEYERTVFVYKYERYYKKKSRIHARLPATIDVNIGDYIKVQECRPLSKIIHAVVIGKVRSAEVKKWKQFQPQ